VWNALCHRNVLLLGLALCCANILGFSYQLWLPTIIRANSTLSVGMATACAALPFGAALVATLLVGRSSDHMGEQRLHCAVPLLIGAVSFALAGQPGQAFPVVMLWLCLTGAATMAWPPPFWVLPTATLGESAAAASVGLINSIGNLGGFIGPSVVGFLLSQGYAMTTAILFLSSCYVVACALILSVRVRPESC
jgi:nitrate/nitrite transporter NarK